MRTAFGLTLVICLGLPPRLHAQATAEQKAAITYVQGLQTNTGGFLSMAPQPNVRLAPTLRATSAAVRALHYLGGKVPDQEACVKFVESCFDATTGGFSDFPRGKPDVFTTAVGLMAVTELGMPADRYGAAVNYLSDNAKGFDDIRIAVAGLERLKQSAPKADAWLAEVRKLLNEDGTSGKGPGKARDTGSVVVTVLRLGGKVELPEAVRAALDAGQRKDGGFGKADADGSDLETSYRVMRCYMMLKARPARADDLLAFVARCRNADGGHGMAPGQPSSVNGTYFAAIIQHWLAKQ